MNKAIDPDAPHQGVANVLYDGEHVQLIHIPADSSYSLLSFDIMHAKADGKTAFASGLARSRNINFFGIVPKAPNWYPHTEALEVAAIVAAQKDQPTIVYGSSMGGYGTLKYGKAAGGDVAIALGPQSTINGATCGKDDPRYHRFYDETLHGTSMRVAADDLCDTTFVGFDPNMSQDAFQVGLLPDSNKIHPIRLTHMGHKCATAMTPSSHCMAIFDAALAKAPESVASLMRQNRKQSLEYFVGLATTTLTNGDAASALDCLDEGLELHGWEKDAAVVRARILKGLERPEEGVDDLRKVVDLQPHVPKYRVALADQLMAMGEPDLAISEMISASETNPVPFVFIRLAKMQRATGQDASADATMAKAREAWPSHTAQFAKV